jgi:hypothetical protein
MVDLDQCAWVRPEYYPVAMKTGEHLPGEPARHTGLYDELNVFGTHTGRTTKAQLGERLPVNPRGFTWRYVPAPEC